MPITFVTEMMNRLILYIFVVIVLAGCEKSISFQPQNPDPLLVVEATIENGQSPRVVLTKSLNYFDKLSPALLAGSFVRNATVEISNGSLTHQLKEYKQSLAGFDFYYYSIDSSNLATAFQGAFNTNYTLRILADGKTYTSETSIPALRKTLDSLWWEKGPRNLDSNFVKVMGKVTDPAGFGNYIRYFTQTNKEAFLPGFNSAFDDQIVDGKTYDIQIDRGVDRNQDIDQETYSFFKRGDTVTVKMCNIDKATFDFWRTMEYSYSSIGNPFSSPTKVLSNIKGGALGYFGGYAAQYRSIIIPR